MKLQRERGGLGSRVVGVGGGPGSCVRLSGRKELGWAESGKGGGGLGCHLAVVESERTARQECGCTSHPLPSCPCPQPVSPMVVGKLLLGSPAAVPEILPSESSSFGLTRAQF